MDPATLQTLQEEIGAYWAAHSVVSAWSAGAQALALLRAALAAGVLDAVRVPSSPAQVATATGLAHERVTLLLIALDAHGVVARRDDAYTLSADIARLMSPRAVQPLANILDMDGVRARALARAGASTTPYTALAPDEQLAVAKGVMGLPSSPLWQATMAAMSDMLFAEGQAAGEEGGRYLELGCGAASALLTLLVLYPRLTAVGVDRHAAALAEARRRAVAVGVADRVELRLQDAREVREEACYDVASWSGHFFPAATRADTLAVAYRALRPGGYLLLSYDGDPPASAEALRQPGGRADALSRLLFSSWGVPNLDGRAAEAEVEGAGFTVVRVMPSPADTLAGMMLVQRPPVS